jgi:hypothetical protein
MSIYKSSNLKRHAVSMAVFLLVLTAGVLLVRAQAPTPPYALFQYSSLTGSGNTITATQIPVVTATGVTVYENLTLQFDADANGNLTISQGFPQTIPAPTILSSGFKADLRGTGHDPQREVAHNRKRSRYHGWRSDGMVP